MLSVSTSTLQAALKILKEEGVLAARPRSGYHLLNRRTRSEGISSPVLRWVWHDPKHNGQPPPAEMQVILGQKLASQGIGLHVERCDATRIQAIRHAGSRPNELLVFSSLSGAQQRLFAPLRNVLLLGLPSPESSLPYVSSDIFPAIRHATYKLWRGGCQKIDLLHIIGRRLPDSIQRIEDEFRSICRDAPHPVDGHVHWIPSDPIEQTRAFYKMIPRLSPKHGFVINAPLSPSLIMMVFSYFGIKIPEQVNLLPVNVLPGQMMVFPPLAYYPYPAEKICSSISRAANHYFQTGSLPPLNQKIALNLLEPPPPSSFQLR